MSRAALVLIFALVLDADSGAASFGENYRAGLYHDRPGEATAASCRFDDFKLTTWTAALSSSYTYDANNPYLLNRYTKPDGSYVDYGYDANGDMTSMQRRASGGALVEDWGYEYSRDRFVKKVTLGGQVQREYERQGDTYMIRRDFTAGAEKRYVRDGDSVLAELNDANQVTATYFGSGMDKMLSETRGSVTKWNLAGPGGSVMAVADVSGDIVSRYRYDAFGKRNGASSGIDPVAGQRTFHGRPHDEGLGLTNFRNRWYDPETGRFAQFDRVEDAGNWGNPFNFVDADPVNNADPMGNAIYVRGEKRFTEIWKWLRKRRKIGTLRNSIVGYEGKVPVYAITLSGVTRTRLGVSVGTLTAKRAGARAARTITHGTLLNPPEDVVDPVTQTLWFATSGVDHAWYNGMFEGKPTVEPWYDTGEVAAEAAMTVVREYGPGIISPGYKIVTRAYGTGRFIGQLIKGDAGAGEFVGMIPIAGPAAEAETLALYGLSNEAGGKAARATIQAAELIAAYLVYRLNVRAAQTKGPKGPGGKKPPGGPKGNKPPSNKPPGGRGTGKVPAEARKVLDHVKQKGSPPRGYKGGRTFQNREGKLPQGGNYREFDIAPKKPGVPRTAERIVVDQNTGKAWYTPDHYKTFKEID